VGFKVRFLEGVGWRKDDKKNNLRQQQNFGLVEWVAFFNCVIKMEKMGVKTVSNNLLP
jgi:hypothetical protein